MLGGALWELLKLWCWALDGELERGKWRRNKSFSFLLLIPKNQTKKGLRPTTTMVLFQK